MLFYLNHNLFISLGGTELLVKLNCPAKECVTFHLCLCLIMLKKTCTNKYALRYFEDNLSLKPQDSFLLQLKLVILNLKHIFSD